MSIQKAASLLNAFGQQLPAIAQADAMGVNVSDFIVGTLRRMGYPESDLADGRQMIEGLAGVIQQPDTVPIQ